MINSNLGRISHHFWDTVTYSSKHSIQNCGQTAADRHMVTIDSLYSCRKSLPLYTIANFVRLTIHPQYRMTGLP